MREIKLLAALGLDDPHRVVGRAHEEIRRVGGEIAVGAHVIEAETHGQIVLGEGGDVGRGVEEGGEGKLQPASRGFADEAVEEGFLAAR